MPIFIDSTIHTPTTHVGCVCVVTFSQPRVAGKTFKIVKHAPTPTGKGRVVDEYTPHSSLAWMALYRHQPTTTTTTTTTTTISRPQIMCDYPLNLSILIRGGKETNQDSLSSCERKGNSSARRADATIRVWPVPCTGNAVICRNQRTGSSSTRMWLLLPQRVIGP